MIFVPDASSVLAAVLPDEDGDPSVLALLETESAVAPAIWPVEVANSMLIAVRRKRLKASEALSLLKSLAQFDVELVNVSLSEVTRDVVPLAEKHRLTVYDALYLSTARSRMATLMSEDKDLRAAARKEGVEVA